MVRTAGGGGCESHRAALCGKALLCAARGGFTKHDAGADRRRLWGIFDRRRDTENPGGDCLPQCKGMESGYAVALYGNGPA